MGKREELFTFLKDCIYNLQQTIIKYPLFLFSFLLLCNYRNVLSIGRKEAEEGKGLIKERLFYEIIPFIRLIYILSL